MALEHQEAAAVWERIRGTLRIGRNPGGSEASFEAMGTRCRMVMTGADAAARDFAMGAARWVAGFESKYSRFLPGSLISRINAAAGEREVETDAETDRILALCHEMVFLTRGTFDPTALPLIRLWDWKRAPVALPSDEAIDAAKQKVGWKKVTRRPGSVLLQEPGMCLDLGGMGKEYAVDQVAQLGRSAGLRGLLVDFGADVRVWGVPPDGRPGWHIGLEDPERPGTGWIGLAVREGAVATSGDYVRKFEIGGRRYGHIIDVRTGRPVENGTRAVSVKAPSCTMAGMLSTAAFVLGPAEGIRLIDGQMGASGVILSGNQKYASRRFYEDTTT